MTRWMAARLEEVVVVEEEEEEEDFRGWEHREGGSPRWIRMDLGGTSAVMAGQVVTKISSLGLEAWVRAAEAEVGMQVEEVFAMEGTVEVGEDTEVPGEMTIVTVITLGEVTTVEGEEAIIEVVGEVIVNAGEVVAVVAEVVVGDTNTKLRLSTLS